jgi:hypothetical protein
MKQLRGGLLAFAVLAGVYPAAAQTFTPAPGLGSMRLDLDTQEGNSSQWELKDLCGVNAVRATLTSPRLGSDRRWAPVINFHVRRGTETANLQFAAMDRAPPFLVRVLHSNGDTRSQAATLPVTFRGDAPVEVAVDWTQDGQVTMRVGDVEGRLQLSGAPTSFAITNSTGEAMFDPLRIGYVGEPPSCSATP